jgi:hypothetical protein
MRNLEMALPTLTAERARGWMACSADCAAAGYVRALSWF